MTAPIFLPPDAEARQPMLQELHSQSEIPRDAAHLAEHEIE
jgi:hypothetical protein